MFKMSHHKYPSRGWYKTILKVGILAPNLCYAKRWFETYIYKYRFMIETSDNVDSYFKKQRLLIIN
jgi:hypothetical protein